MGGPDERPRPKATLLSYPPMCRPCFVPRWTIQTGPYRTVYFFSSPAIWRSSPCRMGSVVRSTLYPPSRHQTLSCTKSLPLLRLRRELKTQQETSLPRHCSMRRVREFCATTRESDTYFPVHHDLPTINCVWRSIT